MTLRLSHFILVVVILLLSWWGNSCKLLVNQKTIVIGTTALTSTGLTILATETIFASPLVAGDSLTASERELIGPAPTNLSGISDSAGILPYQPSLIGNKLTTSAIDQSLSLNQAGIVIGKPIRLVVPPTLINATLDNQTNQQVHIAYSEDKACWHFAELQGNSKQVLSLPAPIYLMLRTDAPDQLFRIDSSMTIPIQYAEIGY